MLLTGSGLLAYSLAAACGLLAAGASPELALALTRARWPLLLLPALCWTGALIYLLPEEAAFRERLARIWGLGILPVTSLFLFSVSFGTDLAVGPAGELTGGGIIQLAVGGAVLAPMLAFGYLAWRSLRRRRTHKIAGVLVVFTLFFALSTALIVFPFGWLPQSWTMLAMGVDLIGLGLAIAYFDAFDQGETLLPDMIRSLDAAAVAALILGGQVALVIALATGPTLPMLLLLLGTVTSALAAITLADVLGTALDRLALRRLPRVREVRSELRARPAPSRAPTRNWTPRSLMRKISFASPAAP